MVVVCVSEFQKVYNCLDITLIERGESYYQEMMTKVVKEFDERGQCAAEDVSQSERCLIHYVVLGLSLKVSLSGLWLLKASNLFEPIILNIKSLTLII